MLDRAAQLDTLTRINIQDLLAAWGLGGARRGRQVLDWLCTPAARQFAREIIVYDDAVGADGLQSGSAWMVERVVQRLEVTGQAHIPATGPALVLANHPGLMDTIALLASLPRPDLRIIAADRPFLRALRHINGYLIYVPEQAEGRMNVVREATKHLRQGGAILTFPAGQIEPDPATMPGALESLPGWNESIAVFAKLAPQTRIVPALVSGVITSAALRHPLARVRRTQKDREWLAATLQIILQRFLRAYKPACVRVAYGEPLLAADLIERGGQAEVMRAVRKGARKLIEQTLARQASA
jgi:1-acyl-sn-glycerol-3-phosphate acyltransferase